MTEPSDGREQLEQIRLALQDLLPADEQSFGVLTGYVIVAQWSEGDGREWLTRTAGDINDEGLAIWTVKGLLYHALETVQRDADFDAEQDDDG